MNLENLQNELLEYAQTEEIDENVPVEQLDIEINELVKEIKKDMVE